MKAPTGRDARRSFFLDRMRAGGAAHAQMAQPSSPLKPQVHGTSFAPRGGRAARARVRALVATPVFLAELERPCAARSDWLMPASTTRSSPRRLSCSPHAHEPVPRSLIQ